ncbi:hypothetical protein [Streptomyces sp. AD55]|uniref:hypothetical protein n=1 Tax=Streptomyces sp. AD55 TaxID=3242895 RepID=UPI003529BEC4
MSTPTEGMSRVLSALADEMARRPQMNADQALRLVVWGCASTPYPGDGKPGAETFREAHALLEGATGFQGAGIASIPRNEAIQAAKTESTRLRAYGGDLR